MRMTPKLIIIGGLAVVLSVVAVVVFLPAAVFRPEPTPLTRSYSAMEERGRDLYVSNGCMYCHSQFTRKEDVTPSKPSEAGEYVYDKPHQLGTLRTGPDLANIGWKRGAQWEIDHLLDPRAFTPNSIMPSFKYLSHDDAEAIVAYLDRLGSKGTASTDLMIPARFYHRRNPMETDVESWDKGRDLYAKRCLTCHGCAGKGDGPYAMMNNARPADLRQERYKSQPDGLFLWRVSDGVPGTVMPIWKQSLSTKELWYVIGFIRGAYMDMVPHFTDEGDLPAEFAALTNPIEAKPENYDPGKALFIANCSYCHGYSGRGDGPSAAGLMPAPPDFYDPAFNSAWKDGDWFWRISESLPMRAMPKWKNWFDTDGIWYLSTYLKNVLALPKQDAEPVDPKMPATAKDLKMPNTASVRHGREVYMRRCWMCHGDAGQGEGPSGTHLRPVPVDFTDPALKDELSDADWFWRVSEGIGNSAMPMWRLLLSPEDRWDAIRYVKTMFLEPAEPASVNDETPVEYQALTPPFVDAADTRARGRATYVRLCLGCHGPKAKGDGKYGPPLKPAPADLSGEPSSISGPDWWYWRVNDGILGTAMPPWRLVLTDQERWEVVWYARAIAGVKAK